MFNAWVVSLALQLAVVLLVAVGYGVFWVVSRTIAHGVRLGLRESEQ